MSDREFWVGAARRVALRRNLASWSDAFLSAALSLTVIAAVLILAWRLLRLDTRVLWFGWGGALLLAAIVCAAMVGRRPFTVEESLARLDDVQRLHNRLTSAFLGVGPWPGRRSGVTDALRWNWSRLATPIAIGALLLGAVSLVELPKIEAGSAPTDEPIAWTQLGSWVKKLDQAKLLDQPALDKIKEQLDDLRSQPRQDWYSQNSLEAGDALQQQTGQSLRDLEQDLEKSADLMTQAQNAAQMPDSQLQSLSDQLRAAAQGMASGNLPLNKELAGQLRSFDPSSLKNLTQAQLNQLQQRLSNGAKICSQCVGPNVGPNQGNQPGQYPSGHPGGGGPAQLGLNNQAENLHTKRLQGASNDDLSRALPAEVIAITKGKHQVNNGPAGSVAGGAISSAGEGGDAVWRDSLTPDERQVLQKYFK